MRAGVARKKKAGAGSALETRRSKGGSRPSEPFSGPIVCRAAIFGELPRAGVLRRLMENLKCRIRVATGKVIMPNSGC